MTPGQPLDTWTDYEAALAGFVRLAHAAQDAEEEADQSHQAREAAQRADYAKQHGEVTSIATAVTEARASVQQQGDQLLTEPVPPADITAASGDAELLQRLRGNDRRLRALFASLPSLRAQQASASHNTVVVTAWAVITGVTALIALGSGSNFPGFFAALFISAAGAGLAVTPVAAGRSWLFQGLAGGRSRGTALAYRLSMGCSLALTSLLHASSYGLLMLIISAALIVTNARRLPRVLNSRA